MSLSLFSSRMPMRVRGIPVPLVQGGGRPCLLPDLWSEVPLLPKGKADASLGVMPLHMGPRHLGQRALSAHQPPVPLLTGDRCWSPCRCLDLQVLLSGHDTLKLPLPQPQSLCFSPVTALLFAMKLQGWRGLTTSFLISLSSPCTGHVVKL